jgi:hypothetical protein
MTDTIKTQKVIDGDKGVKMVALSTLHLRYEDAFEKDGKTRSLDDNGRPAKNLVRATPGDIFLAGESEVDQLVAQGSAREASTREADVGVDKAAVEAATLANQNKVRDVVNTNPEAASKNAKSLPNQEV